MKATLFLIVLFLITNLPCTAGAQSVTLYTAGPDGLAQGIAKAYTSPEAKKLRSEWVDGGLAAQGGAALALIVNTEQVRKDQQPQSWFDLTAPFWRDSLTMPDQTLSGSAAEFIAVFNQVHNQKAWKLFEDLARNGMIVPGPNNAALNPVLSGAKKATLSGVDYISYGQIANGRNGPGQRITRRSAQAHGLHAVRRRSESRG